MSRILVTGGAGYIGSVLVPMLLNAEHEVIVLDNLMYGQTPLLDCCYNKKLAIIKGDTTDSELIDRIFDKYWQIDYVMPLAAIVGAEACDKNLAVARKTNTDGVKEVLRGWATKFIFPNTNSGYGIGQEGIYCTEETPLNPISEYGCTKVEAEKLVLQNGNAVVLRLATVFGVSPRMRTDLLVNDMVQKAVLNKSVEIYEPHFKRNFIHIQDVAHAFLHCMDNFESMKNQVYNLGLSDANLSKWELCEQIQDQVPGFKFSEGTGEDPDKRNYIVSNDKIEKTGFKPKVSLQEGITELIKGYQIIGQKKFSNI